MKRYRGLVSYFLTKAEELCHSLIFGLRPDIDLASLKDDLANANYGFPLSSTRRTDLQTHT
jgi:hypothetical protein